MRVLVVDDDPALRAMLEMVLELEGMEVRVAANGHEALEQLALERPDVLVLDVMMPGLDGWGVAERVRQDPRLADLPIIFCTAKTGADATWRGWQLGAASYVAKPFDNDALLAQILSAANGEEVAV